MGCIYLIRHGQASFGADDYDVLSPIGIRQAEILGAHLAQLGTRLDRSVSGDLRRQQHTANTVLEQLHGSLDCIPALEIDPAFNEFDAEAVIRALLPDMLADEPEALHIMRNGAANRSEFHRIFSTLIGRWVAADYSNPSLLSWQAFVDQVEGGLNRLLEDADNTQNIAVFTSGGTITALLHLITGISPAQAFELNWQIVNTSLSCLKFRGKQVSLASFNSHTHLQLMKEVQLITYR